MSIEELKLILQAISQLGEAGKTAFIIWVLANNLPAALGWIVTVGAVSFTAIKLHRMTISRAALNRLSMLQRASESVREAWLYGAVKNADESAELHTMYKRLEEICRTNKE